jgi:hypothetical protein
VLDAEYAAFWIGSRTSQDWLSGVKKGAAYTGINIEDLRNLPVPLPREGLQNASRWRRLRHSTAMPELAA